MLLIRNIKALINTESTPVQTPIKGSQLAHLPTIENAWLLIEGDKIKDFGEMSSCPSLDIETIDAEGRYLLPSWCDSHTHLVFAASRESEFVDRIKGLSYAEIAAKGGGILNSARRLQEMPEEILLENALQRLDEVIQYGTGAIEIKSGYGLTVAAELKMLRVIRQVKERSPIPIKATFLGAHAYPMAYRENHEAYIKLILDEMLPQIAKEGLADYIDAFCEKGFFSVEETDRIVKAGAKFGLKPKIHTNQFNCMGGIQMAVANQAISVDHLEVLNAEEMDCLKNSNTIATLLPSAPFFLNDHYPPARKMVEADLAIALASDFNPGTTPSGNMPFVLSLACIKMRMLPNEAINAATINGAFAMELQQTHGSIARNKQANVILTKKIPSLNFIPYAFGSNLVDRVIIGGKLWQSNK